MEFVFPSDGFYRPVKQISGAHNKMDRNTPSKTKKKRPGTRGMDPSVVSGNTLIPLTDSVSALFLMLNRGLG